MNAGHYPLYGRCECGGPLTVWHIWNECPLRPQQRVFDEEALADIVRAVFELRHDVEHVAVLGEN